MNLAMKKCAGRGDGTFAIFPKKIDSLSISAHGNSTFLVESIPMLKHTKDLHTAVNTVFYVF